MITTANSRNISATSSLTAGNGKRRRIRALITTPVQSRRGGVSQYFCALAPYFESTVRYFYVGSRSDQESPQASLVRMIMDSVRFANALRTEEYDIVHLNPSLGTKALVRDGILLLLAKASGHVAIVFIHGLEGAFKGASAVFLRGFFRLVYNHANGFVVLSSEVRAKLIELGCERRIFLHQAPVNDEFISARPVIRDVLDEFSRPFRILFLARIERNKGIYEAIETYRLLQTDFPFARLTVAGDGSELPAVRECVANLGLPGVVFTGFVEGSRKLGALQSANVYLFPSYYEGLPLSVLEAMACGLPVVATAVGGLRDFFVDGRMGFLADGPDPAILARLLAELIRNPELCSTIRSFNHAYARDHFHPRQVAVGLDCFYRSVLGWSD